MNSTRENMITDKYLSRSGYRLTSKRQIEDMGLESAIPSESKKFHRDSIVFQIYHLNTYEKRYDLWDRIHQDLGMTRSSLRNAILDNRLEWDPEKADKSLTEGKPHFSKIRTAEFFPAKVITQMDVNDDPRFVEYVKLDDGKNYRVVYVWRERQQGAGEFNARIISLHEAGDQRGEKFIFSTLSSRPFFISEEEYAIWFPHVTGKDEEEGALLALYEYPYSIIPKP